MSENNSFIIFIFLGIFSNIILIYIGYLLSNKNNRDETAFNMINYSSYNVGSFAMPYIQTLIGPAGVLAACYFDVGNAIMSIGAILPIAQSVASHDVKLKLWFIIKKMMRSIPLDTYLIMILLSTLNFDLPTQVLTFTEVVGNANPFIAMLMIGIGLEFSFKREQISKLLLVLFVRNVVSLILSILIYCYAPFSLEIRKAIILVLFAPISSIATVYTQRCKGDTALSSAFASISIIVSIIIMTALLVFL